MTKHYIVLGSSYENGIRFAIDFTKIDNEITNFLKMLKKQDTKHFSIATHIITTQTSQWSEIVKLDSFFDNVILLKTPQEFINYIKSEELLSAIDIVNYIASLYKCTHTRMEKLVYYCYADYLCMYNKKLFDDKIYAFKYGPVIESIYEKYKDTEGQSIIQPIEKEYMMPIRSRIMNSKNGIEKINSIDLTLEKYKFCNTNTLIAYTHRDNTPWAVNGKGLILYKEISDNDILKYHKNEEK